MSLSTLWQDSPKSRSDCVKREPGKKWANSFAIRSVCQLICEAAPHMAKTLTSSEEGKIQRLNCIKITLKIPGESQLAFFSSSKQTNKSISSYCFSAFYWIRESEKIALSIDFGEKPKLKIGITLEIHTNIVYVLASFKYKYLSGRWLLNGSSSTWPSGESGWDDRNGQEAESCHKPVPGHTCPCSDPPTHVTCHVSHVTSDVTWVTMTWPLLTSFQVSGPSTSIAGVSADDCSQDYVIINSAASSLSAPAANTHDRWCGGFFGSAPASITIYTEKLPFQLMVRHYY